MAHTSQYWTWIIEEGRGGINRNDLLQIYDDRELIDRYRIPRRNIISLEEELQADLRRTTRRNYALSPMQQLLIALRLYATGSVQRLVADSVTCDQSTASRAIHRVSLAIQRRLNNYVYFPAGQQEHFQMMEKCYEIAQFPRVVGCVDGTHIHIIAPSHNEHEYVNRKGHHSLNVQLICDGHLRITNCVIKWPGSTHDARILTTSAIYRRFEEGAISGNILGDSANPLKSWLMTPILNPATQPEDSYNQSFLPTRCSVEVVV